MKLTRKIIATIVIILSLVMTFTGCEMLDDILGQISGTPAEHQCENWCAECGKCTDLDCEEDICTEKCEGHTPAHKCESVCTECGKCTDASCKDSACSTKCAGHAVAHKCESVCADCGKCTDLDCEEDICAEKCEGHTPAHKCESVCADCGKCTDLDCKEDVCAEKCAGHTPAHKCESVCPECGKCTDASCKDSACSTKCAGHAVAHKCESACTECGKCTDVNCKEDICAEKCEGHNQGSESAEIKTGTAYKFGMAQGNKGGDIYYLSGGTASTYYLATSSNILEAVDVYVEEANGGYHLYYEKGGKHYINVEKVTGSDGYDHVNAVIADTAITVYTYNAELKTLTVTIDDVSYALGTRNDKEYTTVGPCDISKDPFVCTFHIYEGGNPGGGTGTDENGKFDLSLIPEPDFNAAGFDGYYVVNNNVPFFTDAEKHTTECFEKYSQFDSLGRVGVAFACVCQNTMPTTDREGQSYKPTGWIQNSYSIVSGGSLYNRSHLIAWSLAGENDTKENLATGTAYMNQHTMQIFENMVLNYLKSNKATNKVLYRVTPVFNGDNLLCSGVLMEAYSLDDNGTDVQFCVFVYNIQEGVHLDYATGKNRLATSSDAPYYGTGAGFGTSEGGNQGGNSGNEGGNQGGNEGGTTTPVVPVPGDKYIVSANNANGTIYLDGTVTSGRFNATADKSKAVEITVSTVEGGFVLSFEKNGVTQYIVMDDSSTGGKLTENAAEASIFEWNADLNTYMVAEDNNSRAFGVGISATHSNMSPYDASSATNAGKYSWGLFTKLGESEGGTTNPDQGGTTTPDDGNQGGTTPDDGNTGTEDEKTFTFVLNVSSKKIHDPDCSSAAKISEKNRKDWTGTYAELQQLLDSGYTTCGTCKPATE